MGELRQLVRGDGRVEADDPVVRRMDAHDGSRVFVDGVQVVSGMGAVCGADLVQGDAGSGHDIRNPETAADFNELAAGNDHFTSPAQGVHGKKNAGSVVIDCYGVLRAGKVADEPGQDAVKASPSAGFPVEFQAGIARCGHGDGVAGRAGQDGTARIGVDDHARAVNDGLHVRCGHSFHEGEHVVKTGIQAEFPGLRDFSSAHIIPPPVPVGADGLPDEGTG